MTTRIRYIVVCVALLFSLPGLVQAQPRGGLCIGSFPKKPQPPPPQPESWQLEGIQSALSDAHPKTRLHALKTLSSLLVPLETEQRKRVFRTSVSASFVLGVPRKNHTLVDSVVACLHDEDSDVVSQAITVSELIGEPAKYAIPQLLTFLGHKDMFVAGRAVRALGSIGKPSGEGVPLLIELLSDENRDVRKNAMLALGRIGKHASEAVPHLIKHLEQEEGYDRITTLQALGSFGEHAREATPHLIELLGQKDSKIREYVVQALGKCGKESVLHLIQIVNDEHEVLSLRSETLETLGSMGEHASEAVPHLIKLLEHESLAIDAAEALGKMGEPIHKSIPLFIEHLSHERRDVRLGAVKILRSIGEPVEASVPSIIKLLEHEEPFVVKTAMGLLGDLKGHARESVPHLIKRLSHEDPRVIYNAANALGSMGEPAREAVPHLIKLLEHENTIVHRSAAYALGNIGESAKESVPELIKLLGHNTDISGVAAYALGGIGEPAKESIPALIKLLEHNDTSVRFCTLYALEHLGPGEYAKEGADALIKLYGRENPNINSYAASVLGGFGAQAKGAVPALVKLLDHKDSSIRYKAARSLVLIGVPALEDRSGLIKLLEQKSDDAYLEDSLVLLRLESKDTALMLTQTHNSKIGLGLARFLVHYHGADGGFAALLNWLGRPMGCSDASHEGLQTCMLASPSRAQARKALKILMVFWESLNLSEDLYNELETWLNAWVVERHTKESDFWCKDDLPLLRTTGVLLAKDRRALAGPIAKLADEVEARHAFMHWMWPVFIALFFSVVLLGIKMKEHFSLHA